MHRDLSALQSDDGGEVPELIPAATVVLGRDASRSLEILMLRRDGNLAFAGGMWVFPGGRVDPADREGVELPEAEVRAAVRETREESGLVIESTSLVRLSTWTPPPRPVARRFSTAFFVAPAPGDAEVRIDDGEIREFRWVRATDVLDEHGSGEIELAPPTFLTLLGLSAAGSVTDMLEAARRGPVEHFATKIAIHDESVFALYHGDAGYDSGDGLAEGRRHRIHLHERPWRYERDT